MIDRPPLVFALSFLLMWLSARFAWWFARKNRNLDDTVRDEFAFILTASLTLLGLIVGFSFSVAIGRYDQRKNYEEAEANAIGTEYLRADLLPAEDGGKVRSLLKDYLDQRIGFYESPNDLETDGINTQTANLQARLWSAVLPAARAQPTQITALAVSGMNDVLNSQGYTQSAWWYRIPDAAWLLMTLVAIGCNLLIGYGAPARSGGKLLFVFPLAISIAFMLIADIDSPRHGIIRVVPQNLVSVAQSLRPH